MPQQRGSDLRTVSVSDHYLVSALHEICYSLNGVADVFVLFFEGAFLASSENGVAAKRDNHYVIIGQACSHSEGGSDSANTAYQCCIISEAL
jgi:hypothetical protein